jgi:hypothetical protein
MPKSTEYASLICTILTIVAIIGAVIGFTDHLPIVVLAALLPTVIYEVYRTEGESTRASSYLILAVLIAEAIFILFNINFDLGQYLGQSETYIAGSYVPLGDIKVLAPTILAILSAILFIRTAGIYTKWLSVIIFVTSFVLIYVIAPTAFSSLIKAAIERVFNYF